MNDSILRVALEALVDHARPDNLAEIEEEDPEQYAAWKLADVALGLCEAPRGRPVAMVDLGQLREALAKLRAACS